MIGNLDELVAFKARGNFGHAGRPGVGRGGSARRLTPKQEQVAREQKAREYVARNVKLDFPEYAKTQIGMTYTDFKGQPARVGTSEADLRNTWYGWKMSFDNAEKLGVSVTPQQRARYEKWNALHESNRSGYLKKLAQGLGRKYDSKWDHIV